MASSSSKESALALVMQLRPWLAQAAKQFVGGPRGPAVVSIGNEAGDLDSLASSMALAAWAPVAGVDWVPLAPFAARDFRLRGDARLLFGHVGFSFDEATGAPRELLFAPDEAAVAAAAAAREAGFGLGVALVDHNAAAADVVAAYGTRVVAVVDHHNDEGGSLDRGGETGDALAAAVAAASPPPPRVVDPAVGSTCSLVVEARFARGEDAGRGVDAADADLCVLMLAGIAVDTRGFDASLLGVKYDGTDVRAASRLLARLGAAGAPPPPGDVDEDVVSAIAAIRAARLPESARVSGAATVAELSDVLLAARYDVSGLSATELLRWDYKEVRRPRVSGAGDLAVGVAAICETVLDLVNRSGASWASLEAAMDAAAAHRGGLDLLLALTHEDDGDGGHKGLVARLPAADDAAREDAERVLAALAGVPRLPEALAANALFAAQDIADLGFGIDWRPVDGAPRLRVSRLRPEATRKTLLPAAAQLPAAS